MGAPRIGPLRDTVVTEPIVAAVDVHERYGKKRVLVGASFRAHIDVGWLQNPVYYSTSEQRGLIDALPGHYPTQLAITGAFSDAVPPGSVWGALAYAVAALLLALIAFGLRLRPPRRP